MSISDKLMVRYYDFCSDAELRKTRIRLRQKNNSAFEIGAILITQPRSKRTIGNWNARFFFSREALSEADLPHICTVPMNRHGRLQLPYSQGFAIQKSRAEGVELINAAVQLTREIHSALPPARDSEGGNPCE